MADSGSPYRRIGSNSWEELLNKVNDVLENPEDGCEPLDPIDVPEGPHRWAKSDIREVHDRLNEIPGDCFEFDEIPDLWKKSIIDNIEEELENAWCECEGCEPCQTEPQEWSELHEQAWAWYVCGYNPGEPRCGVTNADWAGISFYYDLAHDEVSKYESAAVDMCFLNMELYQLELDLADAESDLAAAESARDAACAEGPGAACAAAEAEVSAKQQIIDDIEDDITDKEQEIEDARADRDAASAAADTAALAAWALLIAVDYDVSSNTTIYGPEPTTMAPLILEAVGTMPWHRDDECGTKFLFPWRCRGGWHVRKENKCFGGCSCSLLFPDYFYLAASYTPSGIPMPFESVTYMQETAQYGQCNFYLDPALSGCDVIPPPPAGCTGVLWEYRIRYPNCPP